MDAAAPGERHRTRITRPDGRVVNVARFRGQLFVCATGCCCGRTDGGFPSVSTQLYHHEWERRRLRDVVHLTIGGCLGPCALANEALLRADAPLPPPSSLADLQFSGSR